MVDHVDHEVLIVLFFWRSIVDEMNDNVYQYFVFSYIDSKTVCRVVNSVYEVRSIFFFLRCCRIIKFGVIRRHWH